MAEEITFANETASIETVRETTCSALAFDTMSRAGKVKLFNALNSAESLTDSHIDRLTLEGIIVQSGTRIDAATGEVEPAKFTTFITKDGAYFSQSDGIARSAENLVAAFGEDFADEPITVEFGMKPLQGGRSLKYFSVVL
jgi:hypothetical protein